MLPVFILFKFSSCREPKRSTNFTGVRLIKILILWRQNAGHILLASSFCWTIEFVHHFFGVGCPPTYRLRLEFVFGRPSILIFFYQRIQTNGGSAVGGDVGDAVGHDVGDVGDDVGDDVGAERSYSRFWDNFNFCQGRQSIKQSYDLGSARLIWLLNQFVLNSNCVARGAQACRRG
jgi:hypothetical protein